jgi:tetratricopeptide (TPR) repeat protein
MSNVIRRWILPVTVVVVLIVYPAARWMLGSRSGTTAAPATQSALQLSFEHYEAGRYGEAIAAAKQAIQADPKSADAYNNLAVSYIKLGQYDEALDAAQNAIRLKPDFQLAKNNLAWIQDEKAKAAGQPGPVTPKSAAADLLNQSMEHSKANRFTECIDTARQVTLLDPKSSRAFNNMGFCAANLQQWDEAVRNLQEAIRLDPDFQLAKNNLAWAQGEQRKSHASGPR